MSKATLQMHVAPPHEALIAEAKADPHLLQPVRRAAREEEYPMYYEHPVAIASGFTAVPLALYVDGVPIAKNDNVLGIWAVNLASGVRHLSAVCRKSRMCRCGRKHWCSLHELHRWLRWSLASLADSVRPLRRRGGAAGGVTEGHRDENAGGPMPLRGAVIMEKWNWAGYNKGTGLASWSSLAAPCPFCIANNDNLHDMKGLSPVHFPHELMTAQRYEDHCAAAELRVWLTHEDHLKVARALFFDLKPNGARGRALKHDIPELGLNMHDRLEPSPLLPDVLQVEEMSLPGHATFWRRSGTQRVHRRLPLIDATIGIAHQQLHGGPTPRLQCGPSAAILS
jgi:hypothetical protein